MGVASPARTVALRLLGRQRRRDAHARDLLRSAHEMNSLGAKGRALVTRLVLGVNVASGELDRRIDQVLTRPGSLEPRVRDALRLSAFEVLYLDTPAQVSVSQGVELVRSVSPRAARLANAVLRRLSECRAEVDAARASVDAFLRGGVDAPSYEQLQVVSGYPAWLVSRICEELGAQAAARLCACALEAAPVYLHAFCEPDELLQHRLGPAPCVLPGSYVLDAPAGLATSGLVDACKVAVADLAAQVVCRVAAPADGTVLEVGQGRGTKSLLLCAAMRELGAQPRVAACELVGSKVRIATERMRQAGLDGCVSCTSFDAMYLADEQVLPKALRGEFASVLVDAPCSGTGTMRRHPEIAWGLREESLDLAQEGSLPALQLAMLTAAASRVAPGGSLVYATCSVLEEENEGVVRAFLSSAAGRGFARQSVLEAPGVAGLPAEARKLVGASVTETGAFQSLPASGGFDGHYCCRLVRAS